jgi:maleate cis-trans isomerase
VRAGSSRRQQTPACLVGLIVPKPGVVTRSELADLLGHDCELRFAEVDVKEPTVRGNLDMLARSFQPAVSELADYGVNLIVQVGTSPSVALGSAGSDLIAAMIEARYSGDYVIAMDASVAALRSVEADKVAVIAPLGDEMLLAIGRYLSDEGFAVVAAASTGELAVHDVHALPAQVAADLAAGTVASCDADTLYIFGGGWRSLDALAGLRQQLRVPVISSNVATAAAVRAKLGYPVHHDTLPGYGPVMRTAIQERS